MAHPMVALQFLAQPINFSRQSVISVRKSRSAVSQGNATLSKEARCAVVAGACKTRIFRSVECVVPRSVALAFALRRQRSRSNRVGCARFFLILQRDMRSRIETRALPDSHEYAI